MIIIFFDYRAIAHTKTQGRTVNQTFYGVIFERLRNSVLRVRLTTWILPHDNDPRRTLFPSNIL